MLSRPTETGWQAEVSQMSSENWNPDAAALQTDDRDAQLDTDAPERYGETAWEASRDVPLDVALAEEMPDIVPDWDPYDEWVFIDADAELPFSAECPEEHAMHVVVS